MIRNQKDLLNYLKEDKRALGKSSKKRPSIFGDEIWKFEIVLRKNEYYSNITPNLKNKIMKKFYHYLHRKKGIKLGFSIPINVFGPGLRINHYGLIVVNGDARIGANCDIHQGVNIGQNLYKGDVPTIGDNVWIGPGAKIFGKITLANSIAIGANSVVNKSFLEENITIAGTPVKKVKDTGTNEMETAASIK
ncbi:serine acetyltransferase [Bacillus sp. AFS096315]|uniref:serine O-acetyltransferase n=1 Tax=Bacillus sp. AFS096315 TaxID=2033517 RepID=UPI000BEE0938|nr:serine acetyltransferase [Bacillus sp. AFS096315]PEC51931.1 serine acetyltransferase [Bacillus sp. AFS096315]